MNIVNFGSGFDQGEIGTSMHLFRQVILAYTGRGSRSVRCHDGASKHLTCQCNAAAVDVMLSRLRLEAGDWKQGMKKEFPLNFKLQI